MLLTAFFKAVYLYITVITVGVGSPFESRVAYLWSDSEYIIWVDNTIFTKNK